MFKKILNVTLFTSLFMLGAVAMQGQDITLASKPRLADCGCKKNKQAAPKPEKQLAGGPTTKPKPAKPAQPGKQLAKCPCAKPKPVKPAQPEQQLADFISRRYKCCGNKSNPAPKPEMQLAKCPCAKPKPAKPAQPEQQLAECGSCGKKPKQPKILLACEGHYDSTTEENAA